MHGHRPRSRSCRSTVMPRSGRSARRSRPEPITRRRTPGRTCSSRAGRAVPRLAARHCRDELHVRRSNSSTAGQGRRRASVCRLCVRTQVHGSAVTSAVVPMGVLSARRAKAHNIIGEVFAPQLVSPQSRHYANRILWRSGRAGSADLLISSSLNGTALRVERPVQGDVTPGHSTSPGQTAGPSH
jgi:hypothetical protein